MEQMLQQSGVARTAMQDPTLNLTLTLTLTRYNDKRGFYGIRRLFAALEYRAGVFEP